MCNLWHKLERASSSNPMYRKRAAEVDVASDCASNSSKYGRVDVLSVCRTVHVSNELASLLLPTAARRGAVILSFPQLIDYLKEYTTERNLGDKNSSPPRIRCRDDPLGSVLGERDFSLYDLPSLLSNHCKSVCVQHSSPHTTWNPEHNRPSGLTAVKHESSLSYVVNTVQATWKPLNVMVRFPLEEEACHVSRKEPSLNGDKTEEKASTSTSLDDDTEANDKEGILKEGLRACSSRVFTKLEQEEQKHENNKEDSATEEVGDDNKCNAEMLSESESEYLDENKLESSMWNSTYGDLTGYETDIIEINDDNYIYLDDVVTEYDFTEYEPASPTSSEPYSESDSEPCFQQYRGTLPCSTYETSDDDDDIDKWSCSRCTFVNEAVAYRCAMCWKKQPQRTHLPKTLQKKLNFCSQDSGIGSSQSDDLKPIKNCVVCLTKPVSTSLVHNGTAHLVCCYKCARKLLKRRKPCPICRRPIQQAVLTFTS